MTYQRDEAKVIYKAKKSRETKTFDVLEWLAAMCSVCPTVGSRWSGTMAGTVMSAGAIGKKKTDTAIPGIIEADETSPAKRKAWARLIQKIYEVDPLTCPKCKGAMKIISFIDQPGVIKAILQHIGLWDRESRPPPKTKRRHQNIMRTHKSPHMTMLTRITLLRPICKKSKGA